ncbi:uncharacterized protein I303_102138 [Kwoniella dejecticola CBS 10117]|uniref:BZIP domain-containing protein n=1 Tax=Kwoniella dejecticola CBS 10117 TaxID=1296121 RepID=A0A1A6ABS8_9TREE|nr:uncharacterized protein I303_01721 [Kwoniella dejecticola CBS 10117]OBR87514.1 hypothetical protein I303_01721 [Kwoniella dejecticola CBS 10117]
MFPDLPEHLQALNALPGNTPPSAAMNPEQEEAFWGFLHADELFRNFGNAPSPSEQNALLPEDKSSYNHNQQIIAPAPTPVAQTPVQPQPQQQQQDNKQGAAPTLESFIAAYIGQSSSHGANTSNAHAHALPPNYLIPLPTPYTHGSVETPISDTPAGINTSDVLSGATSIFGDAFVDSPEDRISGAKRLKQMGAPQVEIEEDKRRRNTEASARFRAKKKEREQALERRAKDLEAQLAALQAENSSLENENRLLKAIVLNGPTGQPLPASITSSSNGNPPSLQAALASLTQKRKRED